MIKKGAFFFILTFLTLHSQAQSIKSVSFEGIKKTKESYLLQFMSTTTGEVLDSAALETDRNTLANLEVLANASYVVKPSAGGFEVVFTCVELRSLLPIFSFGGIEETFWVQGGVSETNLSGRGHKTVAYYQYYDRSSYAVHLKFDRIKRSPWGMNINMVKWGTLEPLYFADARVDYEYDNYTIGGTAIRHFNFTDRIEFGGAFFTEDYRKVSADNVSEAPRQVFKQKVLAKSQMVWNRSNYHYFYQDGWQCELNAQGVISLDKYDPLFLIFFNDFKRFIRTGKRGNFASRLRLGLSSNEVSPFSPFVLDSYLNIRGVGNRVDRGTGSIILNIEYRHSFIDWRKVALQGVAFSDTGIWRTPGGTLADFTETENLVSFSGIGLRMIHKQIFNAILRIDYGFNKQNLKSNGFVIGIGQYF